MHDPSTTVVAVATPRGRGGIGCVRLSGPDAHRLGRSRFEPVGDHPPTADARARFGRFLDRDGVALDHGYLVLFPEGASYTGEETAELWPHGSPAVLAELVEATVAGGAAPAGPGEFTYRALRHGRLDLARAEAVRDLVAARTVYQARVAFRQAEGALSRRLAPLREVLEEWIARGEAAVEFVDESDVHLPGGGLAAAIGRAGSMCRELLVGFQAGRVVRDGATVAMVGLPNVGKSSLFNRLLSRDRAIVTPAAGTTRDTLEDDLDLDGIPVRLIDTAGLRTQVDSADAEAELRTQVDPVEREGMRRAESARADAELVLMVLDGSRELAERERTALREAGGADGDRTVIVWNKGDLPVAADRAAAPDALVVSALTGEGCDELRRELRRRLVGESYVEHPVLTDARHAGSLEAALVALDRAGAAVEDGLSEELVLEDLREAMQHIGGITGEFTLEDLYDRVFSTFCIGK